MTTSGRDNKSGLLNTPASTLQSMWSALSAAEQKELIETVLKASDVSRKVGLIKRYASGAGFRPETLAKRPKDAANEILRRSKDAGPHFLFLKLYRANPRGYHEFFRLIRGESGEELVRGKRHLFDLSKVCAAARAIAGSAPDVETVAGTLHAATGAEPRLWPALNSAITELRDMTDDELASARANWDAHPNEQNASDSQDNTAPQLDSPTTDLPDFEIELTSLEAELRAMGANLVEHGEAALRGILPPRVLAEELNTLHEHAADLWSRLAISEMPNAECPPRIDQFRDAIDAQRSAVELPADTLSNWVTRASALYHAGPSDVSLQPIRDDIEELRQAIQSGGPGAKALADRLQQGQHRLAMLFEVIDRGMTDPVSSTSMLAAEYGLPFALAVGFGHIKEPEPAPGAEEQREISIETAKLEEAVTSSSVVTTTSPEVAEVLPEADTIAFNTSESTPAPSTTLSEFPGDSTAAQAAAVTHRRAPASLAFQTTTLPDLVKSFRRDPCHFAATVFEVVLARNLVAAYQVACYSHTQCEQRIQIRPEALAVAIIGRHLRSASGDLSVYLRELFASWDFDQNPDVPDDINDAAALFTLAGALVPAFLAPDTLAPSIVKHVAFRTDRFPVTWRYAQVVGHLCSSNFVFDPNLINKVKSQAHWVSSIEEVRERAKQWLQRSANVRFSFGPATKVWLNWVSRGGFIYEMLDAVARNDTSRLLLVKGEVADLREPQEVRRRVDTTDQNLLGRRRGDIITASAYTQIQARLKEAVEVSAEWLTLQDLAPGHEQRHRLDAAQAVRRDVINMHSDLVDELRVAMRDFPGIVGAAAHSVLASVEELDRIFSGGRNEAIEEPQSNELLRSIYLHVTAIELDSSWRVTSDEFDALCAVVETVLGDQLPAWEVTVNAQIAAENYEAAEKSIRAAQREGETFDFEKYDRAISRGIGESRQAVRREAAAVSLSIEQGVTLGLVGGVDRTNLLATVSEVEARCEFARNFADPRRQLAEVSKFIEQQRQNVVTEAKKKLDQVQATAEDVQRVIALLDAGDVSTAHEYMYALEQGVELPNADLREDPFGEFFPTFVQNITSKSIAPAHVVNAVRNAQPIANRKTSVLSQAQAKQVAAVLESWFKTSANRGHAPYEFVQDLFEFIGFTVLGVALTKASGKSMNRVWAEVTTEPVRDRNRCPVALFGSLAASGFTSQSARYRILVVWDDIQVDDLPGVVGETANELPTFVLYLGKVNEVKRRTLSRICREQRRTFAVLDEILLTFLCTVATARMKVFFECSLPFTYIEPFVSTAGIVPPELFFGRELERKSITDAYGTCFIYGGRQLGKTALLRHVERRFTDVANSRLAVYLDLKSSGIGFDRPIDDIWHILAEKLRSLDVTRKGAAQLGSPDKLCDAINQWLHADKRRRMLLLLDETDRFLEGDRDFVRVARLKGLMDATDRRFKGVFAGLHNVQRTTRLTNNPLAHLGEPLCIGPLFEEGEWKEARSLIVEPLAAIGFRFESADLVSRILSQTNYYPSLIQLYGQQIYRSATRVDIDFFDWKSAPPYVLTPNHVDQVYATRDLLDRIRERFVWTLDLDTRYKLIALLIAYATVTEGKSSIPAADIRQHATSWWPAGFEVDSTEDAFRALLDEMVGLGILRQAPGAAYGLRSRNVALLMGSPEDITNSILTIAEKPGKTGYEPAAYRRPGSGGQHADFSRCSPLTVQQESQLLQREGRISIIAGTEAAQLSDIVSFLEPLFQGDNRIVTAAADFHTFKDQIAHLPERGTEGTVCVVVRATVTWSEKWIEAAFDRIRAVRDRTGFLKFIFIANPDTLWQMLRLENDALRMYQANGLSLFTLTPWHDATVRNWLDELGVPSAHIDDYLGELTAATGKWPAFLYSISDVAANKSVRRWSTELKAFEAGWGVDDQRRRRQQLLGLSSFELRDVVISLAELEIATVDDISELTSVPADLVANVIRWCELLSFASRDNSGRWRLDPIVSRAAFAPRNEG